MEEKDTNSDMSTILNSLTRNQWRRQSSVQSWDDLQVHPHPKEVQNQLKLPLRQIRRRRPPQTGFRTRLFLRKINKLETQLPAQLSSEHRQNKITKPRTRSGANLPPAANRWRDQPDQPGIQPQNTWTRWNIQKFDPGPHPRKKFVI